MTSIGNIIRIGNSNGIVIPFKMLQKLGLKSKDMVSIDCSGGKITIAGTNDPFEAISHGGWYEDERDSHEISEELYRARVNNREIPSL